MVEEIISVDYETKEDMKRIRENIGYAIDEDTCNSQCLNQSLVLLNSIIKRMRVFKK